MTSWNFEFRYEVGEFSCVYEGNWSCDRLTLEGPSGTGKSTLIECLLGVRHNGKIQGRARVGGETIFDTDQGFVRPAAARPFAWVPQDGLLLPFRSVEQNIQFGAHAVTDRRRMERLLEVLGLSEIKHRKAVNLSGGEKQRVAVARALFSEKPVLLMDEPLSGVDPARKQKIIGHIRTALEEYPRAVLFVSHDDSDLAAIVGATRLTTKESTSGYTLAEIL